MDSTPEDRPHKIDIPPSESDHAEMIRSRPAEPWRRLRGIPVDSIVVDPSMPGIREYLRRATLDGFIRTAAANIGKVCIIPVPRHHEPGAGEI